MLILHCLAMKGIYAARLLNKEFYFNILLVSIFRLLNLIHSKGCYTVFGYCQFK